MILSGKEVQNKNIYPVLGAPIKFNIKKFNSIGTSSLFLKDIKSKIVNPNTIPLNSKCNFQIYDKGFLIYCNYSGVLNCILLPINDIDQINITSPDGFINPIFPTPFWIGIKLGLSIRHAYMLPKFSRYEIFLNNGVNIALSTKNYSISFTATSDRYFSIKDFFERKIDKSKLFIEDNIEYNL